MGLFLLMGPNLAKRGLKPSKIVLRNKTSFYWVKICNLRVEPFHSILHIDIFPTT